MATDLNTILSWFKTGLKPTQAQFWASWSSMRHKDDMISQDSITDLSIVLNAKAERIDLQTHIDDINAHPVILKKARIIPYGEMLTFKKKENPDDNKQEIGDFCIGFVDDLLVFATYEITDEGTTNYKILSKIEY